MYPVTKSDTVNLPVISPALLITSAGNVKVLLADGTTETITVTRPGTILRQVVRVYSTDTTISEPVFALLLPQDQQWRAATLSQVTDQFPDWATYGFTPSRALHLLRSAEGDWLCLNNPLDELPSDWRDTAIWKPTYCDPINGDDANNSTTWALAKQSLRAGVTLGSNKRIVIVPDDSVFWFGNKPGTSSMAGRPWGNATSSGRPGRDVIVMPESAYNNYGFSDKYFVCSAEIEMGVWSQVDVNDQVSTTSGVWKASVVQAGSGNQVIPEFDWALATAPSSGGIWDRNLLDSTGMPTPYSFSSTKADIFGSGNTKKYYFEKTGSNPATMTFWVSTGSRQQSYTKGIMAFARVFGAGVGDVGLNAYIINGIFLGGHKAFTSYNAPAAALFSSTLINCRFMFAGQDGQGLYSEGNVEVRSFNCAAAANRTDGISSRVGAKTIEMNDWSFSNGLIGIGHNEGFTIHGDCKAIRGEVVSFNNGGPNIADSSSAGVNCAALLFGARSFNSAGASATGLGASDYYLTSEGQTGSGSNDFARGFLLDFKPIDFLGKASVSPKYIGLDYTKALLSVTQTYPVALLEAKNSASLDSPLLVQVSSFVPSWYSMPK